MVVVRPSDNTSDVRHSKNAKKRRVFLFFKHTDTLNLRAPFYRRPFMMVGLVVGVLVLIIWSGQRLFTKAETSDFYPATCLGTWANPQNAQGVPETLGSEGAILLGDQNSALFVSSTNRIYCGNFIPQDFEAKGTLTSVGLTLVWGARATTTAFEEVVTTTEETPTSSVPIATTTPEMNEPSALRWFVPLVLAQETTTTVVEATSSPEIVEPIVNSEPAEEPTTTPPAEEPTSSEPIFVPSPEATTTPTSTEEIIIATSSEPVSTSTSEGETGRSDYAIVVPPALLKVSYSLDGENWFELARVDETNLPNLTVRIPVQIWEDIRNLQISIEGTNEIVFAPEILLDGMFVQANYDVPAILSETVGGPSSGGGFGVSDGGSIFESDVPIVPVSDHSPRSVQSEDNSFNAKDTPRFELNFDELPSFSPSDIQAPAPTSEPTSSVPTSRLEKNRARSFFSFFLNLIGFADNSANAQESAPVAETSAQNKIPRPTLDNPVVARVFTARGDKTDIRPDILVVNRQIQVSVPEPKGYFRPGKYVLRLWVLKNGVIYQTENNFYWGVLALNPNKSIYLPNETANIGIGVLDDEGAMVCDADVSLEITNQSTGKVDVLSTANGTIVVNSTCSVKARTERPDYETEYRVGGVGMYQMKLTAKTANGEKTVRDLFEVRDSVAFDVERISATRIYPPVAYEMKINIGASQKYSGPIEEKVPAVFSVFSISDGGRLEDRGGEKIIVWDANLNEGDKKTFSYSYLAPNESPQFYLIGPLKIGGFNEVREWQIAADATVVTIFITTLNGTVWEVPYDWNNASNTIEVIGGGGGGDGTLDTGNGGGGGGAYAKISNFNVGASTSINVWVGSGGSQNVTGNATYFNGPGTSPSSTCAVGGSVCAKGGREGNGASGGEGGNATSSGSIGTVINAGGNGGTGSNTNDSGGGGGGAGGPNGTGKGGGIGYMTSDNSSGGGGGGGGGGGSATVGNPGLGTAGGAGGSGYNGNGGGASNSNATLNAGGGGGGQNGANGGNGSSSQWWAPNPNYGPGGGGGGGGDQCAANGGAGGLYGGGGGGCEATGGSGGQGIIVIRYTPLTTTITATGTQIASTSVATTSKYIGGAFVLLPDATTTITDITIAENGTVNASTGLDNILLRYDVDNTAPYDCASVSYAAGDTQYGSTDTDGFSSANGTSTFTGQVYVSSTQAMCVYTELDVTASAASNETIEIRISASSSISTGARGAATGTFPLDISGSTTIVGPNSAPTVSNVVLNGGSAITLIENTTKNISVAATSTDTDGNANIAYATATIYRSGVGSGCTADNNNCYLVASTSCTKSGCSGNTCSFSCAAAIQYFAEPTDSGTYSAQNWGASVTVGDAAGATGVSTTASGVELNTLLALNVTGSINYGSLGPSSNTGGTNQTTTVTNTGNATIDVNLSGTDMTSGGYTISVGNQKYATSSFTYSSCTICTALTSSPVQYILNILKPTSTSPVIGNVLWGLSVGANQPGTYSGTNTFEAVIH